MGKFVMGIMSLVTKGLRIDKKKKKGYDASIATLEPPMDGHYPSPEFTAAHTSLFAESGLNNSSAFQHSVAGQSNAYLNGATLGNRNILVITPNTNQDVTNIVENLQNGEACVVNLEGIPLADAQRRLDFLSGVICSINGQIRPLDTYKYILTPQGLGVRG